MAACGLDRIERVEKRKRLESLMQLGTALYLAFTLGDQTADVFVSMCLFSGGLVVNRELSRGSGDLT
jgi:hypothetical protein